VRDFAEMFGDEPDRFFCGHPIAMIKSCQVQWTVGASLNPDQLKAQSAERVGHVGGAK
jgi:hypothetical protein